MAKAISSAPRMTVEQFLTWLEDGPQGARYELVAGEVVAMAPEPAAHARLKAEVWLALRDGIRPSTNCDGVRPRWRRLITTLASSTAAAPLVRNASITSGTPPWAVNAPASAR